MSASKNKDSTGRKLGSRILLIIYALGLVMIGLKPLKHEYQQFFSEFKISPSKSGSSTRARFSEKISQGRNMFNDFFKVEESPEVVPPDLQKEEIKDKKLDKLNDQDREQLQKLIEGL